jgi:hypothetical protein
MLESVQYFAGFTPKDLAGFLYLPIVAIFLVTSIILFILKRNGRPYMVAVIIFPLIVFGWYLYDKLVLKATDYSQATLVGGLAVVTVIFGITSSPLTPNTGIAVNISTMLAALAAVCFSITAIRRRNQ